MAKGSGVFYFIARRCVTWTAATGIFKTRRGLDEKAHRLRDRGLAGDRLLGGRGIADTFPQAFRVTFAQEAADQAGRETDAPAGAAQCLPGISHCKAAKDISETVFNQ